MSGTLTINRHYISTSFDLATIITTLKQGDVVVLHSEYSCALIFHQCVASKQKVDVYYKDVESRKRLLGEGGWEKALYACNASECDCQIDKILRRVWFDSKESVSKSKGLNLLDKDKV